MAINSVIDVARYVARQIGADPLDVLTAISYETGGTLNPNQKGPTTKWGQHRGLIQWGGPQREKYLNNDMSLPSQAEGMVRYFQDAGFKPGMGYKDLYSAINAGSVGRYSASDEAAGGAPGSVLDKVNSRQMAQHRAKAAELIGGNASVPSYDYSGQDNSPPQGSPQYAESSPPRDIPGLVRSLAYGNQQKTSEAEEKPQGGIFNALSNLAPTQEAPEIAPMQNGAQGPQLAEFISQFQQSRQKQNPFSI
ncbi:hypothetical protein [Phyllobacterium sp. SB3]|uniref:hypothetical protein n=1 Tax=Phyllobacterium sp. SB3 TaxID=3156073 RepID=UPI0032AF6C3C